MFIHITVQPTHCLAYDEALTSMLNQTLMFKFYQSQQENKCEYIFGCFVEMKLCQS